MICQNLPVPILLIHFYFEKVFGLLDSLLYFEEVEGAASTVVDCPPLFSQVGIHSLSPPFFLGLGMLLEEGTLFKTLWTVMKSNCKSYCLLIFQTRDMSTVKSRINEPVISCNRMNWLLYIWIVVLVYRVLYWLK